MAEKLVQHKHCRICSKAVPVDEEICSEECQSKLEELQRANRKKNMIVIFMMMMSFFLIFMMIMYQ